MAEEFEATKIEQPQGDADENDVDALIQGAIKELEEKAPKQEKKAENFTSTPFTPANKEEVKVEKEPAQKPPVKQKPDEQAYANTFKEYKVGDIIKGKVAKIDPSGILVDINYKADGIILPDEISQNDHLKTGDIIDVFIENLENKEGNVVLSKKNADFEVKWKKAFDAYKAKSLIEAKVTNVVKGGLVVDCDGLRGFVPASQVSKKPGDPLDSFKDKAIPVKIIEVNRRQGKIIMSHKMAVSEKTRLDSHKLLNDLEVGQVKHGVVTSIKNFGAFVDIGGVEGLVHISELSWKRVKHASEVLKVGQETDVFVLGVDRVNNRIALGLKELQPDPWETVGEKYKTGQIIKGKVVRLVKFGAFLELDEYLEGLVHISELSTKNVRNPEDAVKPGDVVDVKILRILPDEQKIGLSIKEAQLEKERTEVVNRKAEETKVTIGEVIAEKERQKAEKEADETQEEEIVEGKPAAEIITQEEKTPPANPAENNQAQ